MSSLGTFALLSLPVIAFAVWMPHLLRNSVYLSFACDAIEGRLTQGQAKAIDFACSGFLAPLLLALFNRYWFTVVRVTAFHEKGIMSGGVSLMTLVATSITSSGS